MEPTTWPLWTPFGKNSWWYYSHNFCSYNILLEITQTIPTLTTGATAGTGASAWQRETFLFLISKDKVWLSKICLWLIIIINVLLAIFFHSFTYFKIYYNIELTIEFIYYSFNNFHFVVTALNAIFESLPRFFLYILWLLIREIYSILL